MAKDRTAGYAPAVRISSLEPGGLNVERVRALFNGDSCLIPANREA